MIYLRYFWQLLKHQRHILKAGRLTGVPFWRLLIHDWSKFLPSEFIPYARNDRGHPRGREPKDGDDFQLAWLFHQNGNKHHWAFWISRSGRKANEPFPMPVSYAREMVADWLAASKSKIGSWNIAVWLNENGPKMLLHKETLGIINDTMFEIGYCLTDNSDWSWMAGQSFRSWAKES